MNIEHIKPNQLAPFADNARTHSDAQIDQIISSIEEFGFTNPMLIDRNNGIIAGHGRLIAAQRIGLKTVPCIRLDHLDEKQKRALILADNQIALNAGWNEDVLMQQLKMVQADGFDLEGLGFSKIDFPEAFGIATTTQEERNEAKKNLAQRFIVPPFSILDTRQGYWQERRRHWINLGIKSEIGRGEMLTYQDTGNPAFMQTKNQIKAELGRIPTSEEVRDRMKRDNVQDMKNTSIFDPVLAEISYAWFCPENGSILDPFAGGSVRGVVAAWTGHPYTGHELRPEQVAANRENWISISEAAEPTTPDPVWIEGDSSERIPENQEPVDMIFSCPPYADLEVYSQDPKDLSNKPYSEFIKLYREIIQKAVARLKPNRFAVWVVSEIRDPKTGIYRNFLGDTIAAFQAAGMHLYNEAILANVAGSLCIRINSIFGPSRKLGRQHQNVYAFFKGDPERSDFLSACKNFDRYRRTEKNHEKVLVFLNGSVAGIKSDFPNLAKSSPED